MSRTNRMTKSECLACERLAIRELTKALGEPTRGIGDSPKWTFPYGDGGTVKIELIRSKPWEFRRGWSRPWLAIRYDNPAFVRNGYKMPRDQIKWPSRMFTYPSGKANFDFWPGDNHRAALATHLYFIAGEGSAAKEAFGRIEFEVTDDEVAA